MNLAAVWREFLGSVWKPPPPLPSDPCNDPRVARAQQEADEIQATVRMLRARANAQQKARPDNESDC